jgi:Bacteriophage Sf6, terminase small subunit-like
MRPGRTTKRTPALVDALCRVLSAGGTRRAACASVGIDHTQLYRWLETDAPFRTAVEKAEADAELRFTAIVATAAATNWQCACWWLERRRPDDYARRERIDVEIRQQAERLASELGLNAAELLEEAERLVRQPRV